MEQCEENTESISLVAKAFNVLTDPGVQFSVGNACLFWSGGDVPQLISAGAAIAATSLKGYSEFSSDPNNLISSPNTAMNIAGASLIGIGIYSLSQGDMLAASASLSFAMGNFSVADNFEWAREKLSNVFGQAASKIATQAETYYTAGLGVAAYMAAGAAGVEIPVLDGTLPTSLITYVPTVIGGGLAIRNALFDYDPNTSKPFMWLAAGVGATAAAGGISGGEMLPVIANAWFSSAYAKIQANVEGGFSNLATSLKSGAQNLLQRVL